MMMMMMTEMMLNRTKSSGLNRQLRIMIVDL